MLGSARLQKWIKWFQDSGAKIESVDGRLAWGGLGSDTPRSTPAAISSTLGPRSEKAWESLTREAKLTHRGIVLGLAFE